MHRTRESKNLSDIHELLEFLDLDIAKAPYPVLFTPLFPFAVSLGFAQKITKGDWFDPLLLQVIPREEELLDRAGFAEDAVGDLQSISAPGLLHKYSSRVLLMSTKRCAGNCRFCFRRSFTPHALSDEKEGFSDALRYIEDHREITEVVLSGGEPLCLSDEELNVFLDKICFVDHVGTVRFHTRALVTMPSRFSDALLNILDQVRKRRNCVFVFHVNHPRELDQQSRIITDRLSKKGIMLFSQSVLLRDVNDSVDVLGELFAKLIDLGIVPYYLHQLDRVRGASHFEVSTQRGLEIMEQLRARLPGYAVPRYVREVAGEPNKTPLF
ncbi:MAG: KamA family radical SAM protein [Chitinispirillaceae bacterium]